jgi:hypothetical protein
VSSRHIFESPARKPAPRPSRLRPPQQQIPGAEMPPRLRQRDMSPSKLAQLALDAHPEMSNRAIAAEKGVNRMTVCRLRRSTEAYDSIERTIGLDGKSRPARRRVAQPIPRNAPAINADLNWRAEVELVVGVPRADRRSGGTNVPADMTVGLDERPARTEGRQKGRDNV